MTRMVVSLLLFVFVFAGCGTNKRPAGMPKLTPCEFTFQYEDGTPLEKAFVMMYPVVGQWYANGTTDSNGFAKMSTQGLYTGAAPGEYKVTVTKQDIIDPPGYIPGNEDNPASIVKDLIDRGFATPDKTPLKINVATTPIKETFKVKKPK